jgi:hypothetical protein
VISEANRLEDKREDELLKLYSELLDELRRRGLTRTNNNPVADYAEKVVIDKLGLKQAQKEAKGYDALDDGIRYQIKGRRITRHNRSRQLGVIRNLDEHLFDFLVAAIFDESFALTEMWKIPHSTIKRYASWSKQQNGYILHLQGNLLLDPTVQRII